MIDLLGEGAFSAIYAVQDPKTQQLYALKHVQPADEKDQKFIEQLRNEFELSKLFRHPGLRKCVDLKVSKKLFGGIKEAGLVMEMIDGVSLDNARPTEIADVADWFLKAGSALGALHHLHLIHCDLKPGNILRTPEGRVKVIDFGQACRAGTTKGRVQGTPDFIAPEQVKCRQLSFQTDVYGFGATLYWALTGRRVPTLFTVKKENRDVVREQKFASPAELNPAVPADLSELVMDCVRLSPAYRPQNLAEVIQRLQPFGPKQP